MYNDVTTNLFSIFVLSDVLSLKTDNKCIVVMKKKKKNNSIPLGVEYVKHKKCEWSKHLIA